MSIVVRDRQSRPTLGRGELRAIARVLLARLGGEPAAAGVAWVGEEEMVELHDRFMGDSSSTDVLSFPDDDFAGEGEDDRYWGDVVVCTDQAARQAVELGHSYRFELAVLVLHGFLHLRGYDHTRDEGEMRALEEELRPRSMAALWRWS